MKIVNKDITTVTYGIVAHGVNCSGVMGSGIARAIRNKWPACYDTFMNVHKEKVDVLGEVWLTKVSKDLYVANLYTQIYYGNDGKRYANPLGIQRALDQTLLCDFGDPALPVHLPKIGCGLGGLDWETEVKPIFEEMDEKYPNRIVVVEWE